MSLHRGKLRRSRMAVVLTTVGALVAFQALAIVGAGAAFASGTCTYNPSTDTIEITIDSGTFVFVRVDETTGAIEFGNGAPGAPCGSATNSNTAAIIVLGQPSSDENFHIEEDTDVPFNTAIAWHIDLGTGDSDGLEVQLSGDQDNALVLSDTSFNLNGAVGELLGVEEFFIGGDDGDDTVDGSATSKFMAVFTGEGDDVVSLGTFDGDVAQLVGGGVDTLSYSTRTTCTFVLNDGDAGLDANCDGDNDDPGDEEDFVFGCFDVIVTGSGNDTIDNTFCSDTTFAPGPGDDEIINESGSDTLDLSSSTAGVVIDVPNSTATGQGTDTWEALENFIGSDFDDTLLTDGDAPGPNVNSFSGLGGIDTVDGSAETDPISINLDNLDPDVDDLENAIGGAGNDTVRGNDLNNQLSGGAGDDELDGFSGRDHLDGGPGNDELDGQDGNDTLVGGPGDDDLGGDSGADTVTYVSNTTAGVTIDLSLGFATSSDSGDDTFEGGEEIFVGSNFRDQITGGPFSGGGTVNFVFKGKGGRDLLTGFAGNDTLNGGKGPDILRGAGGDDTLLGKKGADTLVGGRGFDIGKGGPGNDSCRGVEQRSSC
jgi:Ca2+-binding RTX toxin-like protein